MVPAVYTPLAETAGGVGSINYLDRNRPVIHHPSRVRNLKQGEIISYGTDPFGCSKSYSKDAGYMSFCNNIGLFPLCEQIMSL